jgi:hypothetical protein
MGFTKEQQKLMDQMLNLDGAVQGEYDVYSSGIESPSPSMNYCFDNTWLLPDGYTLLLGGKPKGGKSLLLSAMIGMLHKSDPDAVVIKYNTEFREKCQMTPTQFALWGIDRNRYRAYETNKPECIFDPIEQQIPKLIQAGVKVRMVAIDSVNEILGRRSQNADSVNTQQIGDEAKTLQDGFKRIKGVLRQNNVSLILTCQVRAEMDRAEQMRGHTIKMAVPFYVQHSAEMYMMVERFQTKAGKFDLTGKEFKDGSVSVDATGQNKSEGDESGHKIRVKMVDSSIGRPGRVGVLTIDHDRGIINTHEEVFLLGVGFGLFDVAGGGNYTVAQHPASDDLLKPYCGRTWRGKENILAAIRDDNSLYDGVIRTCKRIDLDRKNGVVYKTNQESSPNPNTAPESLEC